MLVCGSSVWRTQKDSIPAGPRLTDECRTAKDAETLILWGLRTVLDEQEFRRHADQALSRLQRALNQAAEDHPLEADLNSGALTIEFEEHPAKFVVSPNTPVRQIWLSAHSKSYKLEWDAVRSDFVLPETGQTLAEVVSDAVSRQLGEEVTL